MNHIENAVDALKKAQKFLRDISASELEQTLGVRPRFAPGQEVWIMKKTPSWYSQPVYESKIEDGFEEDRIEYIKIGERRQLHYRGCGDGDSEKISLAYCFSQFNNDTRPEELVWESLEEAVKENKKEFKQQQKKYKKELQERNEAKKDQLRRELEKLNK